MEIVNLAGIDPILALNKKLGTNLQTVAGLHPFLKMAGFGTEPGTQLDYAVKLPLKIDQTPRIVMVGCGGTGSHLLPNILQYVWAQHTKAKTPLPEILLIDGDDVEQKNLVRQKFTHRDLGLNKAQALASRYTSVFGMRISAVEGFLKTVEDLETLAPPDKPTILVGAVDNHRARYIMWQYYLKWNAAYGVYWIDAGNEGWHGQVILGARPDPLNYIGDRSGHRHWTTAKVGSEIAPVDLPCFFDEYPDEFHRIGSTPLVPQNDCAVMVEADPQTIQANMMSAFCATSLIIQVLSKEVRTSALYFDAKSGNTKGVFLTRNNIATNIMKMDQSRKKLLKFIKDLSLGGKVAEEYAIDHFDWLINDGTRTRT